MGGVVFAFEDIVVEAVEPLVDRRTESRKVSRRGLVMGCGVLVDVFLEDIQGFSIADGYLGCGSIARIDVCIELFWSRQVQMECAWREIAIHGEVW